MAFSSLWEPIRERMMGGKEQSGQEDVIMEEKGEENKAASGTEGLMVPRRGSRRAGTRIQFFF